MMSSALTEQAAALFGVHLSPAQADQFATFSAELAAWNEKINLTAITAPEAVQVRHFLDSLSVVKAITPRPGLRVIDVGTGAGFPGLPLKLAYPDIHITLMEATGKKITFLQHLIQLFGLSNARALHARAEEAGQQRLQRAHYDWVVARSVARMPVLLEYLLPLARVGGFCLAMKGESASAELNDAKRALSILGGQVKDIIAVQLPGVTEAHNLVIIEKVAATPGAYPRRPGLPTQKPL